MTDGLPTQIPWSDARNRGAYGEYAKAGYGDIFGAAFGSAIDTNPTPSFLRLIDPDQGPELSPEEAAAKYSIGDLTFNEPIAENKAKVMYDLKRSELMRSEIIAQGPKGFSSGVTQFGAGLVGSLVDPLNLAVGLVPGVGLAKASATAGKASMSIGGAALRAGAVAAAETAALEPIVYMSARKYQQDYGMADSLMNVAFGGIIGGGFGAVGRAIGRRAERAQTELDLELERLDLKQRSEVFKTSFMEVAQDQFPRNADVMIQRYKLDRIANGGLQEITYKADGKLSTDNVNRLQRASGGRAVAAIPIEQTYDSRAKADAFVRKQEDRSKYIIQRNEATNQYEVAKVRDAAVVRNELGQIRKFDNEVLARKEAARYEDAKVVPLVREKGKAAQDFIIVKGIADEDIPIISARPSMVEFYEPIRNRQSVTPESREQVLRDHGVTLKEPKFDPNDLDNNIMMSKADHAEIDAIDFEDADDAVLDAQADKILKELGDDIDPEDMAEIKAATDELELSKLEAEAMIQYAICKRGG